MRDLSARIPARGEAHVRLGGHSDQNRSEWIMTRVSISELKSHLSEHLRRAEAGEVIDVLDRARPIAKVVPSERSFAAVRSVRLPPLASPMSSLDALRQERGSR